MLEYGSGNKETKIPNPHPLSSLQFKYILTHVINIFKKYLKREQIKVCDMFLYIFHDEILCFLT